MEHSFQMLSPKLLFSNIVTLPSPSRIILSLKRKHILHHIFLCLLIILIITLLIVIIIFFIQTHYLNVSIKESNVHQLNLKEKNDELITTIKNVKNKQDTLGANINGIEFNMTTFEDITPIVNNEINHLKNKVSPLYHHFLSLSNLSSIIEGVDEMIKILHWIPLISDRTPIEIDRILISLLYKGSRDSDDKKVLHLHCDNKSPLLILFKAKGEITNRHTNKTEEVTIRLGGITKAMIQSNNQFIKVLDESLIIFSLDNGEKYKVNRSYSGLYTGYDMLINFGFVIYLVDNWRHETNKLYLSRPYKDSSADLYKDNPWPYPDQFYTAMEVEVFHIKTNYD